jgi:superfamily II DNA/RNA helicase
MSTTSRSRDQLAALYFEQLPYEPYPVQEEALLAYFTAEQGVLVCAPTGMGKTLIAEAALFEALHTGKVAYYTTPLIALTDQKFHEMQEAAVRWGFHENDIGLVTGNRRVNTDARVLVVVAEILLNRLLHKTAFDFSNVAAVVMDEFHSFNDPERGIVWELTLGLLPQHIRLLLLSATVGNSLEFVSWLRNFHNRRLELVQGSERKVPLTFQYLPDMLLSEQLEAMASGDEEGRKTPALVFCFNREECWNVAEQLKGKRLLANGQQARLADQLSHHDWSQGAGPKLKQVLQRGVGVHHAGLLPKYRRIVEQLFQQKLLSVCICTETLSAGINLPARSVLIPNLLKGPPGKKKLIEPSAAHQMFGRAGRPQFDTQGYVFGLAHEDDVKILRWREKYDQIPEDTKDPGLRKAKKALKKKMPTRRATQQYWTEGQFDKLKAAAPGKLSSRGLLPWRLLAYMLDASPEVELIRKLVGKRLLDEKGLDASQKAMDRMLMTLWTAGYVTLDPKPPKDLGQLSDATTTGAPASAESKAGQKLPPVQSTGGAFSNLPGLASNIRKPELRSSERRSPIQDQQSPAEAPPTYKPKFAYPTPELEKLSLFRGVNPLYGVFLINQLGIADRHERIQAMESVLELPGSVGHFVRVPRQDELPPGPLATTRLDVHLLRLGLVTAEQLGAVEKPEEEQKDRFFEEEKVWVLTLADKLRMLFNYDFPGVHDVHTNAVWAAGELLEFGGDFNNYVTSKGLQKQEGIIFRHLLRLILLAGEFTQLCPPDTTQDEWRGDLQDVANRLTATCRQVDPESTDKTLEEARVPDGLEL